MTEEMKMDSDDDDCCITLKLYILGINTIPTMHHHSVEMDDDVQLII